MSRRRFLQSSGAIAGGSMWPGGVAAFIALSQSACTARDEAADFRVLSAAEALELEAIAARIMPTTDTPGAREAGVIHFMDQAFDSVYADRLEPTRAWLAELKAAVTEVFPGAANFSDLNEADQDAYLQEIEDSEFFESMRFLTLAGFFSMSKYGGNRDDVGWKLIGMHPNHGSWAPPFGYYDAQYMQGESDGE